MIFTPQQYIQAPQIVLPYKSESGLFIEELTGRCKKCDKPVEDLRGHIAEHPNCTEIRFAGVCHPCKLITSFHLRHYNDGRILTNKDDGWHEINIKPNWYSRLMEKINA